MNPTVTRPARMRLDQLLVERGLAESRARAQALVLAGKVRVGVGDAARHDRKPGDLVPAAAELAVSAPEPYVGRGGYKLAAAVDDFGIDPQGLACLDVGASTGGFTDVLLQHGATKVYAIDVGRGQLAEPLRLDPRVVSMERTNARTLTGTTLPEPIDLAVVDLSFISLRLVLGPIASTLRPGGRIVALVKPQFEARRAEARRGVVRDPAVHARVLREVVAAAEAFGLGVADVAASPITGADGNREFLLDIRTDVPSADDLERRLADAVESAP